MKLQEFDIKEIKWYNMSILNTPGTCLQWSWVFIICGFVISFGLGCLFCATVLVPIFLIQ